MPLDTRDLLLSAELLLERLRERPEVRAVRARRRRRRRQLLMRRLLRVAVGMLAILVGVVVLATHVPLGFWGVLLLPPLLLAATILLWRHSAPGTAQEAAVMPSLPLPDLVLKVEELLVARRDALSPPARPALDRVLVALAELEPQLARAAPSQAETAEARRLLADHLPRLLDAWAAVPAAVRRRRPEADRRLAEGLELVAGELSRLGTRLAEARLDALETEERFLKSRYAGLSPPER
ncbi:MAG: hypothetical protein NZM40_07755 [Sphingomonadaceae bacterium]|uniref:hypothetical protein n=1 Tax=Thermaurantiacus sp. TaxID=2820283 RepID=UPI00298EF737|nr:hypothetical protein [Thermaurantiacus sp.]MCS6987306.1 hypothetical protein [Sphingomonadaceae bacterium]MDW8414526.1 hypothetical protein [Thermaurantiacus sp.]